MLTPGVILLAKKSIGLTWHNKSHKVPLICALLLFHVETEKSLQKSVIKRVKRNIKYSFFSKEQKKSQPQAKALSDNHNKNCEIQSLTFKQSENSNSK